MTCPNCKHENTAGAKFCSACGKPMPAGCPTCGAANAPGAKFCSSCGQALGTAAVAAAQAAPASDTGARARLEQYIPKELLRKLESARTAGGMAGGMAGERRVVTVLFCDVKGSTAAAAQLDPEDWAEIMNGAFEHLIKPVYRYEGTLARLMGDAVLAFFGAPVAHEDDPQRAVLAGLAIVDGTRAYGAEVKRKWELDFEVRVGINTGLVVVGEVGTDLRVEYTAMGDAVNIAARMEQTADPGTVQITEPTLKLVAPWFDVSEPILREVKGKSEPVPAFVVRGAKAQPTRERGIEGLSSPIVGRDKEQAALREAVGSVRRGSGQVISVIGEAGLGKSRLTAELRREVAASGDGGDGGDGVAWFEGRARSYETQTPYAPFVDLFRGILGQREAGGAIGYGAVKAGLEAAVGAGPAAEAAPFIATMLGVAPEGEDADRVKYLQPPQIRGGVFQSVVGVVEALAARRPLVLVLEDLHWADATSLDLCELCVPLCEKAPLGVLALFRPQQKEASWKFHELASRDFSHRYTPVLLSPLDEAAARTLVGNLLHIEGLPDRVRNLILAKAEGNPFFVEEVIRSLLDAGLVVRDGDTWRATREIETIAVPDTLSGVLGARLDRLDEESKRVAQTAAVLGREFDVDTLAAIQGDGATAAALDAPLGDLQRRGLVREKSRLPRPVYLFKHGLTQEAAYASLLLARRRELHKRAAEHIERADGAGVNEIARHFLEAKEPVRALPHLVAAGERAAGAYASSDALSYFGKAMEILATNPDKQLARRAYEGLAGVQTFTFQLPAAMETYERMRAFGKQHDECAMQVSALNKSAMVMGMFMGQMREAEERLHVSEKIARARGDMPGLCELNTLRCAVYLADASFDKAVSHLAEAAEVAERIGAAEPMMYGKTHTANMLTFMTRFDEAWPATGEALRLAESKGAKQFVSELMTFSIPMHHLREGDLAEADRSAREGTEMALRIGHAMVESDGFHMQGTLAQMRGDYQRAIGLQEQALAAARRTGLAFSQAAALCSLGTLQLDISEERLPKALEYHGEALKVLEQPTGIFAGASSWAELGFCAMAAGNLDLAASLFEKGLTVPTAPQLLVKPMLLIGSAFVAMARGDIEAALRLTREARDYAEERRMSHFRPMVLLAGATVAGARGEIGPALDGLATAEVEARRMGMLPAAFQATTGAARMLAAAGRTADADRKRAEARALADEIAALFTDAGLRGQYRASAERKLA